MFKIFRNTATLDHLGSAKQKFRDLVSLHLETLALRRGAGITVDAYGTVNATRWMGEAQYFVDKVVRPALTSDETGAIGAAGLNVIAQELLEERVRAECARMDDASEHDMTVPVVHPPDLEHHNTDRKLRARARTEWQAPGGDCRITRGLIIRPEPLEQILSGRKTWEMRANHTHVRGPVALIQKGSKSVFAVADIVDSRGPLSDAERFNAVHLHGITPERLQQSEVAHYRYAWVLANVQRLARPIAYQHRGGVIFVTLDDYAAREVDAATRSRK